MVKHDEIPLLKAAYESNAEELQTEGTDSKLIVPYTGEIQAADAHLVRLARFAEYIANRFASTDRSKRTQSILKEQFRIRTSALS